MIVNLLNRQPAKIEARVPKGARVYAVGDIHGSLDLLDDLLARIGQDLADRPPKTKASLIFLGDYIDRGPKSAGVMARLSELKWKGVDCVCLKGNHEAIMEQFLHDPISTWPKWLGAGGGETLSSYGIAAPERGAKSEVIEAASRKLAKAMPKRVSSWFKTLQLSHTVGDYMFVHAGVRPDVSLKKQTEHDLLWIRAEFKAHKGDFGAMIVHGHTPELEPVLRPNRIGIDTMAYSTGVLTCLVLEKDQRALLQTYRKGLKTL